MRTTMERLKQASEGARMAEEYKEQAQDLQRQLDKCRSSLETLQEEVRGRDARVTELEAQLHSMRVDESAAKRREEMATLKIHDMEAEQKQFSRSLRESESKAPSGRRYPL